MESEDKVENIDGLVKEQQNAEQTQKDGKKQSLATGKGKTKPRWYYVETSDEVVDKATQQKQFTESYGRGKRRRISHNK
jgi:hypothetical protein